MALITSDNPKTVSKTYSNWWLLEIKGLTLNHNQPNQTFGIQFIFIRGNKKEDGTWELSPFQDDVKSLTIEDVFALAASEAQLGNMAVAQTLESLLNLSAGLAKANNVID